MATRVIIGWDTEYQQVDPEGLGRPNPLTFKGAPKRAGHKSREQRARQAFNEVLAYSICILNPDTGEMISDALIAATPAPDGLSVYADWRKRLTMFGLVISVVVLAATVSFGCVLQEIIKIKRLTSKMTFFIGWF